MISLVEFLLDEQEPVHINNIKTSCGHSGYTHDFCDIFNQFFKTKDRQMLFSRLKTFAENGQCTYMTSDNDYDIFGILVIYVNGVLYITYPIDSGFKIWELDVDNKFKFENIDKFNYQKLNREHLDNCEFAFDTQYVCIVDFDTFMLQNN